MSYDAQGPWLTSRRLGIFFAVAEEGSLTRAAARLALSQPAVTRELRILERGLATVLFERLPRGVRLTEAGETLLAGARALVRLEQDTCEALGELAAFGRGSLVLAASNTIGNYVLPRVIVAFHRLYPRVTIDVRITNSREVLRLLGEDRIGLGFIESEASLSGDVEAQVFASDELVPVVAPSHPLAQASRISLDEALRGIMLLREEGSGIRAAVESRLQRLGRVPADTLTLGTTEAIKDVLRAGIGLALLPRPAVATELAAGLLVVLPLRRLLMRRRLAWVKRRYRRLGPAYTVFLQKLEEVGSSESDLRMTVERRLES